MRWRRDFFEQAQALYPKAVASVHFSGTSYQYEIVVKRKTYWVFLQFGSNDTVRDAICSCDSKEGCVHLCLAYMAACARGRPFHLDFEDSFWKAFFLACAEREAYELLGFKTPYVSIEVTAKKKEIEKLLFLQEPENESNSLKFFNLTQDDLLAWKSGRPRMPLRFELSPWANLAKHCFLKMKEPFSFHYEVGSLEIKSQSLRIHSACEGAFLEAILPYLSQLTGNCKIIGPIDGKAFTFDAQTGKLYTTNLQNTLPKGALQWNVGDWNYYDDYGFVSTNAPPAVLLEEDLALFLKKYAKNLLTSQKNFELDHRPHPLQYEIFFNKKNELCIFSYLFEKGDLQGPCVHDFGEYIFVPLKGFVSVGSREFEELECIFQCHDIATVINQKRAWFQKQEGFSVHLAPLNDQLTFEVTKEGIAFLSQESAHDDVIDLKEWQYVKGLGFFPSQITALQMTIQAGFFIAAHDVEKSIGVYRSELEILENFFAPTCPVLEARLKLYLRGDALVTEPTYRLDAGVFIDDLLFFGGFVYEKNKGFSQMPLSARLPAGFGNTVEMRDHEAHAFYTYTYEQIAHRIDADPRAMLVLDASLSIDHAFRKENGQWHVRFSWENAFGTIDLSDIWQAQRRGQSLLFTDLGAIDLFHKSLNFLRPFGPEVVENRYFSFQTIDLMRLYALEGKGDVLGVLGRSLVLKEPFYPKLKASLRDYQATAVSWIFHLFQYGLSGLLCDDMGLGKTVVGLAFIAALEEEKKRPLKVLVACPAALVWHWKEKIEIFLPHVRARLYRGAERRVFPDDEVIIVSYSIVRSDITSFHKEQFDLCIFDELQYAKNAATKLYDALSRLSSGTRLGLSGTPVENNLYELKALLDLVVPGYMPGVKKYKRLFIQALEDGDERVKDRLKTLISPFVLRRLKSEVLPQLPPKTQEIALCEPSQMQKELIQELVDDAKGHLHEKSSVHVFALLTRIKQILDHPAVYLGVPERFEEFQSGKFDLFCELLAQARGGGHKVVVFTQYLHMLDIFEAYLRKEGIRFASIRGSTRGKIEELFSFRHDASCEVFLGSLLAVGVGIDLTAASVVIHYDRWWSAARENQATDRVHRIGQERGVSVFKLLTMGTLEERIEQLIATKEDLAEGLFESDAQALIRNLSSKELLDLIQG